MHNHRVLRRTVLAATATALGWLLVVPPAQATPGPTPSPSSTSPGSPSPSMTPSPTTPATTTPSATSPGSASGGPVPARERVHPDSSCTPSGMPGGPIAQSTVLARAAVWVNQNVPYTANCAHEPGGLYRLDCSGFVSMAWGLTTSLSTWDFNPNTNGGNPLFVRIARAALLPGDAVVADTSSINHIALFTGWAPQDNGQHRYANLDEESTFGVGTIAVTADLLGSYWGAYTPVRYAKVTLSAQSGAAAVYTNPDYHVFWTAPNGQVVQSYYTTEWHSLYMGGSVAGAPGATYHSGVTDLFGVTPDGQVMRMYYSRGWSSWQPLAGLTGWAPGITAVWTGVTYHLFGHDSDGNLLHGYYSSGWHMGSLGGQTSGTPGVTFTGGQFDVFAVDESTQLLSHLTYSHGAWGNWTTVSQNSTYGSFGAGAMYNGSSFHVFLVSPALGLKHEWYTTQWTGPLDMGGTFVGSVAVTYHDGICDLFGPGGDGLYQATYTPGVGWNAWHKVA